MTPRKVIIDTDPGVDDVLAMLLAFSALPEELEVLLISVTYGNVDLQSCLRNVISLFFNVEKEIAWREKQGRRVGFETLRRSKPIVAIGPEKPLSDQLLMADFFHGIDGLGGIHASHPHLSPADEWKKLFAEAEHSNDPATSVIAEELRKTDALFIPSRQPSSSEILRLLREHEPDTITIVAIGPLTNIAMAAATDPEAFLRVKELVVMGGAIHKSGNITPLGEFNTFADAVAAARVYALTSPNPRSTMPPTPLAQPPSRVSTDPQSRILAPYPDDLSRRLKVTLFPLDITDRHELTRGLFKGLIAPLNARTSPLAEWVSAFLDATFNKIESLQNNVRGDAVGLALHDPLCIWYCMNRDLTGWTFTDAEDIRIETMGQWTRGNWLSVASGNRLARCTASPFETSFGEQLLVRVLGL